MTKDDIIRMAREAGAQVAHHDLVEYWNPTLERFAALVAAAEREACAMLAERSESAAHCAAAIRARSQQ